MNNVFEWVKKHIFIVIFVVVMVAGVIVLPMLASQQNAAVKQEIEQRAAKNTPMRQLRNLEANIPVHTPGAESINATRVNRGMLRELGEIATAISNDAEAVEELALNHNRKGREPLIPRLFPAPPSIERETLPRDFYDALIAAYDQLLESVDAGSPPPIEQVQDALDRAEERYRIDVAAKDARETLTEEEQAELRETLTLTRVTKYAEQAASIDIYCSTAALPVPYWDKVGTPPMVRFFEWQWDYWITQDVLRALEQANADDDSVIQAPAKRVVALRILDVLPDAAPSAGQRGGFGRGQQQNQAPAATPLNPKTEVTPDYSASLTGRRTNPLYDVRNLELELVVSTTGLPKVLDAIAAQNFMTIINMQVMPHDGYADIANGYFYGNVPTSRVVLTIETVWLREWTTPYMPDDLKRALGIPVEQPQPAAG